MCPQNFLILGWSNPPGGGGVSSDPGEKNTLFEIPGEKISTWEQNPKPVVLLGSTIFRCRKPTKNPTFSRRLRRDANNIQFLGSQKCGSDLGIWTGTSVGNTRKAFRFRTVPARWQRFRFPQSPAPSFPAHIASQSTRI